MISATQVNPRAEEFRRSGEWEGRTVTSFLREAAERWPDRLALIDGESRQTYARVWSETLRLAAGMDELGLQRGSVVSYLLPNWAETAILHHAVTSLGLVNNPIVPIYRHAEVGFIFRQAKPSLVVIPHRFRNFDYVQMLADLRAEGALPASTHVAVVRPQGPLPDGFLRFSALSRDPRSGAQDPDRSHPADVTLLLYTSGTTGTAKGALHSHETLSYESRSIAELFSLGPDDAVFMASPVSHITGLLYGLHMPTLLGAKVAFLDLWDARKAMAIIEGERCTFTVGATPFLQGLLDVYERRNRRSSLRAFVCGGADVPPQLVRRSRDRLGTVVVRAYGSTEFPTLSCSRPGAPLDKAAETDGRPIGHAECRLLDSAGGPLAEGQVGEIAVNGPERFLGYLDPARNEGAFVEDGFFLTGDLASVDADGFISIQGRKKDIIIRMGEKISAKEVEDLLFEHPAVAEVAVVGVPDARLGEMAWAYVALEPGAHFDFAEMTGYLATRRVARQKFPEHLEIISTLPKTASGKVEKFRLREDAAARAATVAERQQRTPAARSSE